MYWMMVFFDLPVGTKEERKAASGFRKTLLKHGFMMLQFSVYARPCTSADRVKTQWRHLKSEIPPQGEVRGLVVTNAQWERMMVVRGRAKEKPENMPQQLLLF